MTSMSSGIFVTIIVPIYNIKDYLRECLESLERQTLRQIEVIMVNDGSTDGSEDIAKEFCRRNNNFKLINRENGGLSAARNTGLAEAQGEFVYFIDGDDYLDERAIEKLYNFSVSNNLDQLRFVAYTFKDGTNDYQWTRDIPEGGYRYLGHYEGVYTGLDFYQRAIDNNDYYPSCCLIFIRKSVIDENNLRFYEGILYEDHLFNFELTTLCKRVALFHEPLYYRRYRVGSITTGSKKLPKNRAMCISAEEADKFIELNPQIKGRIADWQMTLFINTMFCEWEQMTKEEQDSDESKEYFKRVRPLLSKYAYGGISTRLFYTSYPLYRLYKLFRNALTR